MDPRQVSPQQRKANLSTLMKRKKMAQPGQPVNMCPFGCTGGKDEFTPEEEAGFITVTDAEDAPVSAVDQELADIDPDLLGDLDPNGYCRHLIGFTLPGSKQVYEPLERVNGMLKVNGRRKQKVQPGDKLIRITTSYRVYRQSTEPTEAELEALTAPVKKESSHDR